MALNEYTLNGLTFQFADGDVPKGAERVDGKKAPARKAKAATPRNKEKTPDTKATGTPAPNVEGATDPESSV